MNRLESAIPLLLQQLKTFPQQDLVIVFPDDGATKRFKDMFSVYSFVTCAKVRNGDHCNVVVKDGKNYHIVFLHIFLLKLKYL